MTFQYNYRTVNSPFLETINFYVPFYATPVKKNRFTLPIEAVKN